METTPKVKQYYETPYLKQKHNAFQPLYADNVDTAVINLAYEDLSQYKLLVIPGEYLMDKTATDAVRDYVERGGTAILTASSSRVDGNNEWYNTALPGNLTDVFGVKTHEFNKHPGPLAGSIGGTVFKTMIHSHEVLEPSTAQVLARFSNLDGALPAVTSNRYSP